MSDKIRVRIAPSPTGPLHLGTARSALFNYLFAKKHDGNFVLRIEDTDIERIDPNAERDIIEGLLWLGIKWDEGPEEISNSQVPISKYKGKYGPYRQSERIKIYTKYIKQLFDEGKAYHCFCTLKELEEERKKAMARGEAPIYSGKCRKLTNAEIKQYQAEGKKSIIRFKVPKKKIIWHDLIRGKIEIDTELIGDISIAKDFTTPLYNFAVVIDDYTMKISHVIRGEDHISNTPKQLLLQEALKFPHPVYAHLPLILGPDRSKLSKRHGATSITAYKNKGYLPEAMVNFMALLGWNPKTEQEIFSMEELIEKFDLKNVGKAGAIFNIDRLNYLNGFYIRRMGLTELTKMCIPYLEKAGLIIPKTSWQWQIKKTGESVSKDWLKKVIALEQERMKKFSEISRLTTFFFLKKLNYDPSLLIWKKMKLKEVVRNLKMLREFLESINPNQFSKEKLKVVISDFIKKEKIETGEMLWPFRVALSGREASPGPFEIAEVLGKDKTLERLSCAIKNSEDYIRRYRLD